MIDQAEERLLLTSGMTVERPCKDALRTHEERQIGVHSTPPWSAVKATPTGGELVEPNRSGEIPFCHQRAKRAADRIARIEALRAVGHIGFVRGKIIEAAPRCGIPEIGDRWNIRHIAATNVFQFLKPRHRYIGPIPM